MRRTFEKGCMNSQVNILASIQPQKSRWYKAMDLFPEYSSRAKTKLELELSHLTNPSILDKR